MGIRAPIVHILTGQWSEEKMGHSQMRGRIKDRRKVRRKDHRENI